MILPIYLAKKFLKTFMICALVSHAIFFIFSLIGNLGEKLSFKSIFLLSALNSFQIFAFIPSHLFIFSLCLLVLNLKSQNELIIIKEYIGLSKLILLILPILVLFNLFETKKDNFSNTIEKIKLNITEQSKIDDMKVFVLSDGNKKKYTIVSGYDQNNSIIEQYLSFESQNKTISSGELSTSLYLNGSDLFSRESTIYENDNFQNENFNKRLFGNFISLWSKNSGKIIKNDMNNLKSNFYNFQSILFNGLFYLCISMIFLSKRIVDRGMNIIKIFLIILIIFLYFLLIPKIMLNNFQHLFMLIAVTVFILTFFKIKQYE